ncbi:MAG: ATP-dependent sacrificial sulfur transferase LarE [Tissierellia bacterium]|nr:ATP-dependent sacrificial sulfur transferase LarE [Tissierellia bacterium]
MESAIEQTALSLGEKFDQLVDHLRALERVAIAYSGGVDSSFLMKVAVETLGREQVLGIFVDSSLSPQREVRDAIILAGHEDWQLEMVKVDLWQHMEKITSNPVDRCYFCKGSIFDEIHRTAEEQGFHHILDGTNTSDLGEYRPGLKALREREILSPLLEAGLSKGEIRSLSKEKYDLPTWNKPSAACLASRIPYGEEITPEKLALVEEGEAILEDHGFLYRRLRLHGPLARIEIPREDFPKFFEKEEEVIAQLKALGIVYVTLDLEGLRSGSGDLVLRDREGA